jgi:RNA polymerase sigma-70 factor (ECF subfamily)
MQLTGGTAEEARAGLARALEQVARGDRRAFHFVYQRTSPKLYGVCCRILGEGRDAEDALQEAYVNVWRRAERFDASRASPITWLSTIARNAAIDRLRARGTRTHAPIDEAFELADDAPRADALLEDAGEAKRLHGCIGELQVRDAALIRTAFMEGASYPEIAERANEPLATIKSRIRRALIRLKDCLCR